MTGTILSFGELLLRMSPLAEGGWIGAAQIPTFIGGAECNVATALANWGVPSRYITALPLNYMGDDIVTYLDGRGIDTQHIHRSGNRVGIYFLQQGRDLKHAGLIYDRYYSSFYDLKPGMIDWDAAFEGVSWFNFSAITPAINENLALVCKEALEAAKARGITVSIDLNYRARLWQWGRKPVEVMPELASYCDVIMGNIWAANSLLGIPVDPAAATDYSIDRYLQHSEETAKAVIAQFPQCSSVANTFRFEASGGGLDYYTTLFTDGAQVVSPFFHTLDVVDKIGSGDCFMGGLIRGLYQEEQPQDIIDFAASAAYGKLRETGDASAQRLGDVQKIVAKYGTRTESAGA